MTQISGHDAVLLESNRSAGAARLADYAVLVKPRITMLVVITAYIGFAMGGAGTPWSWLVLVGALAGTALSCMGAGALNQVVERDADGLMTRTRQRPIPAGRIPAGQALIAGLILSLLGVCLLWLSSHGLAAAISAITIVSYVLIYTPLKRRTSYATLVGAVPGALPPVIGYAAATGGLGPEAWLLFAIMFVWQVPHFLAIAWLYREDYARAGMPMLPVVDPSGSSTFRQILSGCLTLLPLGLMPTALGMSGQIYFVIALLCGLVFLGFAVVLIWAPSRARARSLFLASLVYLPVVLTAMMVDRA